MESGEAEKVYEQYRPQLEEVALLVQMKDEEVQLVLNCSELRRCQGGEVIFRQGEPGDSLFIILEGRVRIEKEVDHSPADYSSADGGHGGGDVVLLARFKTGDFFGEMSLVDIEPRSATARIEASSVLLEVSIDRLCAQCYDSGKNELLILLMTNLARTLSRRLRETNEKLSPR